MSTASKIWIVVVVLLIIAGVWWYMSAGSSNVPVAAPVSSANSSDTSAPSDNTSTALPTAPTDTSDAALDADLNSVNGQMDGLNTDTSNVDQGVDAESSTTAQ